MSGIRVTYSGLVSLSFGLAKIIVGLFFVTIITRLLLVEEFGTWAFISGLFVYGVVLSPIFSFWATRETARKINSGKTSVLAEGLFTVAGMGIYILAVMLVSPQTDVDHNVLIFAVLLIPAMYIHKILSSINLGWKPHTVPLSNFYADLAKIPLVLIFLYYLDMGVVGVIIAFFIGYVINNIALLWYGREKVKNKIKIFFNDICELIKKKNIFEAKFDLIFCDPPFKDTNIGRLIELIFNKNLLNENGVIILHRNKTTKERLPDFFKVVDERIYGISKIIFGKFLS